MEKRINIICALRFARRGDLISYQDNYDGTATVEASQWIDLPLYEGSGRMTVTSQHTEGFELVRTHITARLKERIPTRCVGILQVEVCGSGTYLVGTDDLPVTLEATTSLTTKSVQTTHQNTHFPLKTA